MRLGIRPNVWRRFRRFLVLRNANSRECLVDIAKHFSGAALMRFVPIPVPLSCRKQRIGNRAPTLTQASYRRAVSLNAIAHVVGFDGRAE